MATNADTPTEPNQAPNDDTHTDADIIPPVVEIETLEPTDADEIESDSREESAHMENIAVVPDFDQYGYVGKRGSANYTVFSGSGREYSTDPTGNGSCMDMTMNDPEAGCKHNQRLMIELNRGLIPAPGESVDEWMETTLYERVVTAAEHLDALQTAQQAAREADDADHDPSDYEAPIETTAAILDGLQQSYQDYRERVNPDAPDLPAAVEADESTE